MIASAALTFVASRSPRNPGDAFTSRMTGSSPRKIIGIIQEVLVRGPSGGLLVRAKVDIGAVRTTLDTGLAKGLDLGPVLRHVRTRAAAANHPEQRDVVSAVLEIAGQTFEVQVAVTDRQDMQYHMIIGMDVLRRSNFLLSPRKGVGLGKGRPVVESDA